MPKQMRIGDYAKLQLCYDDNEWMAIKRGWMAFETDITKQVKYIEREMTSGQQNAA